MLGHIYFIYIRFKLDGVLLAHAVEDVPHRRFEGLETGVGFRAEPLVLDFAPEGLDFIEMGALGGQVEDVHVLLLPGRDSGLKGGCVVDAGVVEFEHRGPGAGGGPGAERIDDKGRVQAAFAGGGVQLVGGGVVEPNTLNRGP